MHLSKKNNKPVERICTEIDTIVKDLIEKKKMRELQRIRRFTNIIDRRRDYNVQIYNNKEVNNAKWRICDER